MEGISEKGKNQQITQKKLENLRTGSKPLEKDLHVEI